MCVCVPKNKLGGAYIFASLGFKDSQTTLRKPLPIRCPRLLLILLLLHLLLRRHLQHWSRGLSVCARARMRACMHA